jgi:cytoskeletal protein CcmA (bactofilin family)
MPRRLSLLGLVVVALLWLLPAVAQGHDKVVITGGADVPRGQEAGDVVVVNGATRIDGRVTGRVVAVSDDVTVSGRIDGDLVTVAGRAILLPSARVGGDLLYGDEKPRLASRSQVAGDVTDEGWRDVGNPATGFVGRLAFWLAFSVSSLVLGLVLLWFAPRAADATMAAIRTATGPVIGWGFAILIGLPILAVIALITLIGIPFGVALLLAMLPLLAVGYVTGAWLLGRRLVKPPRSRYVAFLAGWGILRVVALIPFLGGLAWAAATIVGLGALVVAAWRGRRAREPEPAPAPAA